MVVRDISVEYKGKSSFFGESRTQTIDIKGPLPIKLTINNTSFEAEFEHRVMTQAIGQLCQMYTKG